MSLRLSVRRFTTTAIRLFEKEKEVQAQAANAVKAPAGHFQSFAQYRVKIVQEDPLSMQTRRMFVLSNPGTVEADEADAKFRKLAKKISYRED
ncbi:hypothetical protein KL930_001895 [Ogataea haglerorum]|uniref:Uncharacterized protein n=1 Tax=Ogataea haglerorum TaxID=1937702 RepID=A0AAN6I214_9ASCO|nr:uncharacterized protein KL911_001836 [Ogataea haglerorum]KAG7698234.1 hypothetical protein KL915_001951 [Ogataea haglerorum]KAG7699473.1 hypothetical protein KL951_001190 [Ogataea haglerorum]KAG7708455.1 hypothetical protein KL914_002181 [Ogataea haglerorum]KAG7710517.1 hypothetical protein KL950_001430 [Ogataea haglerorum]KAG7721139.1 hypothetical protein KL913_000875 [Ogataea haglerorum]